MKFNPIEKIFANKEYVIQTIQEARNLFCNINTTPKQYEAMQRTLSLAYLYCPPDYQNSVLSALDESIRRYYYFVSHIWQKQK